MGPRALEVDTSDNLGGSLPSGIDRVGIAEAGLCHATFPRQLATEGHDLPDMQKARELLKELGELAFRKERGMGKARGPELPAHR